MPHIAEELGLVSNILGALQNMMLASALNARRFQAMGGKAKVEAAVAHHPSQSEVQETGKIIVALSERAARSSFSCLTL